MAAAAEFAEHGSLFRTEAFKRLVTEAELTGFCTFAYSTAGCVRGFRATEESSEYIKGRSPEVHTYIHLAGLHRPEAGGPVLDALNSPDFQCNHEPSVPRCSAVTG